MRITAKLAVPSTGAICDHALTPLTGGFTMPLQDLRPINDQLADIIVRAKEPWIETEPGKAWMKVLWTGAETGRWVALFRWKKGYVAAPHKHLSDAHTFILKGKLQVRVRGPGALLQRGRAHALSRLGRVAAHEGRGADQRGPTAADRRRLLALQPQHVEGSLAVR